MKATWLSISAAAMLVLGSAQVSAAEMPPLAKASGCTACHAIDKKIVGPSWQAIADKYKGSDAKADLIAKVKAGGKGNWEEVTKGVPMPPYSPRVADADIEKLVDFVIGLAP